MAYNNQPNTNKRFVVDENGNIVAADGSDKPKKGAAGKRAISIILWILAICFEGLAVCRFKDFYTLTPLKNMNTTLYIVLSFIIDLILVVAATLIWKSANRIELADKPGQTVSGFKRHISVILSVLAFFPFVIIVLMDKDNKGSPKVTGIVTALICIACYVLTYLKII